MYDPRIGRFLSCDKYYYKYRNIAPYSYALNSPVVNLDIHGDSVWTTTSPSTLVTENGITYLQTTISIHLTLKVFDISDQPFKMQEYIDKLKTIIITELDKKRNEVLGTSAGTVADPRTRYVYEIGKIEVEKVSSMDEVRASDHLMVIVDEINPGFLWAGNDVGVAAYLGKISYVKNGWHTSTTEAAATGAHEFFHNLGLVDMYEPYMKEKTAQSLDPNYKKNHMYNSKITDHLTEAQIMDMWINVRHGEANRGENHEILKADESNGFLRTSTPKKPYDSSAKKGEKIPKRLGID